MRFPLRNNIVIPNNSLLSRKYLHHEICNTIERSAEVSGKETAACWRDVRLPLCYRKFNKKTSLWLSVKFYSFMVSAWCTDLNTLRPEIVLSLDLLSVCYFTFMSRFYTNIMTQILSLFIHQHSAVCLINLKTLCCTAVDGYEGTSRQKWRFPTTQIQIQMSWFPVGLTLILA